MLYVKYSPWTLGLNYYSFLPEAGFEHQQSFLAARNHDFCRGSLALAFPSWSSAQDDERVEPGHSIGKVSTQADMIVLELDDKALATDHLFDLADHTLHFTPNGSGYRIEAETLQWDSDFGPEVSGSDVRLQQFTFPYSGQKWNAFRVGRTGSIRFGPVELEADFFPCRPRRRWCIDRPIRSVGGSGQRDH
jgi:hypothetical protein